MRSKTEMARIASLIKSKRSKLKIGLREAAKTSGISASTLSRLERFESPNTPDTETLTKLAKWLDLPISKLISTGKEEDSAPLPNLSPKDQVKIYLRSAKNLKPETAEALIKSFNVIYEELTASSEHKKSD